MKDNLTQLTREGIAKALENTGGGNSQSSALRSEGAQGKALIIAEQFSQGFKKFFSYTESGLRDADRAVDVTVTSYGASDEHPMSTRSASDGGRWMTRGWKYAACMLMVLCLGIGNVWGVDFTPANIVAGASSGNISVSTSVSSTGTAKLCTTQTSVADVPISNAAGGDYNANYIEIKATSGTISSLSVKMRGNSDGSSAPIVAVFWNGDASGTFNSKSEPNFINRNTTDCDAVVNITVPSGTKTIRLYRQIKVSSSNQTTFASSNTTSFPSSGNTFHVFGISATAASGCAAADLTAANIKSNGDQIVGTGITFQKEGTPASGDTWYWQTSATGTDKTHNASSENYTTATTAGSYTAYLRAYNSGADCWGTAISKTNTIISCPFDVYNGENVDKGKTTASGWTINSSSSMAKTSGSSNGYSYWYQTSSSSGDYVQFDGSIALAKDDQIKIQWTHTNGSSKTLQLRINGSSATLTSGSTASSSNLVEAVYDVPSAITVTSIKLNSSGSQGCIIYQVSIIKAACAEPSCSAPTDAAISGTTSYTEGDNISLTASATGATSATFTWYKGVDWATASAGSSIGSSATFTKNSCAEGDAGTYWCNISNGTGCEVQVSKTITVAATPSCAAGVPGDISKGTASGGTGTITLTAAGDIVSGDAWYWQNVADGTATNLGSGKTKDVNAAGTFYIRSYNTAGNCWSAAKSVTVDEADLLTAISPTLSYATSNIVVGNTSSPTLEGNTGSGSVSYALNNVSPAGSLTINPETGVVTAVTAGGTATVTATIAANGGYAGNTATSGTITVVAPATGTATISYALSGSTTTGTVTGVSTISSLSSSLTLSTLTLSGTKDNYSGAIKGCTSLDALDEDDYVDVQFTVASGYAFTPSSVTVKANPFNETGALKAVVKIMDAQPLVVASNVLACEKTTDNEVTFASAAFTDKEFEGTVHIRMYFYGPADTKTFYIKSPISITGTVATKVVKYDLSFAAGIDASGSMSTLKYAEGAEVTLPACTFTAPTGKEFDAWVVTKTVGGASVTVTNGKFTMPAEAVTATATWKDRPKHTDATLSDLTVGGETVTGFAAATTSYNVELPFGTFAAPTVAATATDASYVKSVVVTQASSATGDATVVVTAEDGSTTKTYTVHFSVAESKDIRMVWQTTGNPCGESSAPTAVVLSTDDAIKDYLSISFVQTTETAANQAEEKSGSYLSTGKSIGNLVKITAKPGYAFKNMSFYGKIETNEVKCPISIDGGEKWIDVTGTVGSNAQHCDVFTNKEAHEIILKNNAASGTWIRHMDLTMIQACTPKTIAWTTAPSSEYEVGKSGYAIAASANNGTVTYASDDADVIAVNSSNGALTLKALGTVTLSASVPAGDGVTYCNEGAQVSKANVKTYYLVTFDAQNETAATTAKYYSGDAAIALPSPSYSGYVFQGWFDAAEGGNQITGAITPTASRTVYAQWEAQCAGPTITVQPASANYFVGRTASALTCEATAGAAGALTYTWYSCDDTERKNPVALAGAPTPSTAAVGTSYYYCTVQETGCDVVRTSNVAVITVAEKDPVCIIKATPSSATEATADGAYKGSAYFKANNSKKLNSTYDYVAVQLMAGKSFLATDKVVLNQAADLGDASDITKFYVFTETPASGKSYATVNNATPKKGDNWFAMPAELVGKSSLYIGRVDSKCNPTVGYMAVYRVMNPILTAITINGSAGELDELEENTFNVMIPYDANLASLTVVPTIIRNAAHATTPQAVVSNDGAWVIGDNTYRVMDKDGDYTDYTIALTRDVAVESVTVSGETTVAAKSQITLTATVLPADVANKAVTWSSSDETKAIVDANGVVTGKAEGSVTITATSVADNTKKGTKEITVTKFVGTEYAYWFASTTDATTNNITNDDGTIFENAPTDGSSLSASLTMDVNEVETTYSVTRRSGDSDFGTFHVPADYTANLHMLVIGSGSPRTLTLKETSTSTEYSSAPATFGDAAAHIVFANIPSGNYTFDKHSQSIRVALMVAELNSYPLTSIALEESFNLRLGQSRTPVFTLTPTKAAVASQVWSEVSRTGASDANLDTSTGEITAGTEEGTITVKLKVTDAFGNEAESSNCVVKIVNIIEQKDVTGPMTWDWTGAGTANTTIDNEEALVLGNYINGDQWAYIKGTKNDYAYNTNNSGCYQGYGTLSFKTTVPGLVTITARRISNDANLKIGEDVVLGVTNSNKTSKAYFVPAGEVNIIADATNGMRILEIEFDANITADKAEGSHFGGYTRPVTIDRMGTVCVDHNVPAGCIVGAEVYKLLYWKYGTDWYDCQMVDFEQVEEMNAGEPYMIIPTESTFALFYGKTTVDNPKAMSNGFIGTFDAIDAAYENVLTGKYGIVNNMIQKLGNNCYSPANRAYIDLSQTPSKDAYDAQPHMTNHAPRKRISLGHKVDGEPIATGLDAISIETDEVRKVMINGEMYIIRAGHIYNANGMLVK